MFYLFFSLSYSIGEFYKWYLSPNGSMSNKGTIDSPYGINVEELNRKMKRIGSSSNFELFLLEGEYHFGGTYGLSFSKLTGNTNSIHIIGEPQKKVRIVGGNKIENWSISAGHPHLWTTKLEKQISQLFVNDKRAIEARVPKIHNKSRTFYFEKYDDSVDSKYEIRKYWVQHDCIRLLSNLPNEELQQTRITDFHGGRWNRDNILKVDAKNDIIYTRVLKSSIPNFGVYPIKSGDMFFIENLFPALTLPGEWYQFPNGTVYYYPTEDDDLENPDSWYSDQGIGIHTAEFHNVLIENVEVMFMKSHALYFSESDNITVRNVTVKHCGNGFSSNSQYVTIENSLFEDLDGFGGRLHTARNTTIRNNIFRTLTRRTYDATGLYLATKNQDVVIENNDISGSYSAPIMVGGHSKYDMETIYNVTIRDNHIHHCGMNVMDDFGGVQGLAIPNGCIVDHNWIHDMNAAHSIGNGLFFGTGAAGVIMKNNLVHDISHDAMKMDHGVNITLHNNIFGFARYMMTWTTYVEGTHTFNIDNNIFLNPYTYIMTGPWTKAGAKYYIDKNVYWHLTNPSSLRWAYKTFEDWNAQGNDVDSLVEDPLFVDPSKRNFSFSSNLVYKKIGFKPFSMVFGVIGDEWRRNAECFKQEEPYGTPAKAQTNHSYGFEDDEEENVLKFLLSYTRAKVGSKQSKVLELESTSGVQLSKDRPEMYVLLNWAEGVGEFSMSVFIGEETWFNIDMGFEKKINVKDGFIQYNSMNVSQVPINKWFKLKISVGYGKNYSGNFKISVDDGNEILIKSEFTKSTGITMAIVKSNQTTYIDSIEAKIKSNSFNDFSELIDDGSDSEEEKHNNRNGKIAGIVIGVIAAVIAVGVALFFGIRYIQNRKDNKLKC